MVLMSIGETDPHPRPLTVDDLEHTPDDGRRYELVDGRLDVSAAPASPHGLTESRLVYLLNEAAPEEEYTVIPGPGVIFSAARTHFRIPDIAVMRNSDYETPQQSRPPVLAIEIISPSSVIRDTHTKREEYAEFGIESYWLVNPDEEKPGILELRLENGRYREVSQVFGTDVFETDVPFPVKLVPYWLLAIGGWRTHIYGGDLDKQD